MGQQTASTTDQKSQIFCEKIRTLRNSALAVRDSRCVMVGVSFEQQCAYVNNSSNNKGRRWSAEWSFDPLDPMKMEEALKDRWREKGFCGTSAGFCRCGRFDWLPAGRRQPKMTEVGRGICIHFG